MCKQKMQYDIEFLDKDVMNNTISVRLPNDMYEKLTCMAQKHNTNIAVITRTAIDLLLNNYE